MWHLWFHLCLEVSEGQANTEFFLHVRSRKGRFMISLLLSLAERHRQTWQESEVGCICSHQTSFEACQMVLNVTLWWMLMKDVTSADSAPHQICPGGALRRVDPCQRWNGQSAGDWPASFGSGDDAVSSVSLAPSFSPRFQAVSVAPCDPRTCLKQKYGRLHGSKWCY